ncbi:DUF779 domain-containing protein [Nocardia sp. NBC_01730]|uniref:DUF779 domain-containing protein n=1 Tax=Nocardia sp. NBC_01730 TaxID=2975998 RepID=UPI002E0ECBB0|nr:DUF779 domain-containing protein [Nocardia sp. NBC_01730]
MPQRIHRVDITDRARIVLRQMIEQHGAVLFHQSAGGRNSDAPVCLPVREFRAGRGDVLLGNLPWHTEFWMSGEQYELSKHTHLTVDVVNGRCAPEAPEGVRFTLRSRLLTDKEAETLADAPPPRTGADRLA